MQSQTTASALAGRRYRATVRTRLALTYSALLTGAGIVMLAVVYGFMRFVPTYDLFSGGPAPAQESPATGAFEAPVPFDPAQPGADSEAASVTVPATELRITSTEEMLNLLLVVSIIVLVVLAVAGIAVGWAVAGRMLRPLQYINSAMGRAATGDLQHRINLSGPRDEVSELAANFDEMLAQLDRSFTATRRFAANASHELLTPLATTRAMLDLAIAQRDDPAERVEFERLRLMNERSIETAKALLELAELESGPSTIASFETLDLAAVAESVASLCAGEAAALGVQVTLDLSPTEFTGDPVLARQLVTNLLLNSVRHNIGPGGTVTVVTQPLPEGAGARLVIENDGERLKDEVVASLMEPFTRAAGRSSVSSARGHGLGLSIVDAIVRRFRGEIALTGRPEGGIRAELVLPKLPDPRR